MGSSFALINPIRIFRGGGGCLKSKVNCIRPQSLQEVELKMEHRVDKLHKIYCKVLGENASEGG